MGPAVAAGAVLNAYRSANTAEIWFQGDFLGAACLMPLGSGLLISRAASPSCPAAQAGIDVEEVLRVQIQHEQAWGEALRKSLEPSFGPGWAGAPVRNREGWRAGLWLRPPSLDAC